MLDRRTAGAIPDHLLLRRPRLPPQTSGRDRTAGRTRSHRRVRWRRVESFPNDTHGNKTSASFLHNVTRSLFQRAGFRFERTLGKNKTLMRTTVRARRSA